MSVTSGHCTNPKLQSAVARRGERSSALARFPERERSDLGLLVSENALLPRGSLETQRNADVIFFHMLHPARNEPRSAVPARAKRRAQHVQRIAPGRESPSVAEICATSPRCSKHTPTTPPAKYPQEAHKEGLGSQTNAPMCPHCPARIYRRSARPMHNHQRAEYERRAADSRIGATTSVPPVALASS